MDARIGAPVIFSKLLASSSNGQSPSALTGYSNIAQALYDSGYKIEHSGVLHPLADFVENAQVTTGAANVVLIDGSADQLNALKKLMMAEERPVHPANAVNPGLYDLMADGAKRKIIGDVIGKKFGTTFGYLIGAAARLFKHTLIELNPRTYPGCSLHASHPRDVARAEDKTFICTDNPADKQPMVQWIHTDEARAQMAPLMKDGMKGKTMYVIPYVMGPLGSPQAQFGVEVTDSAYVAASMMIMARSGKGALDHLIQFSPDRFVKGLHVSGGYDINQGGVWHFLNNDDPLQPDLATYGSAYGGNALFGKKMHALRLATAFGKRDGWIPLHMLILELKNPANEKIYIAAGFPSACGKTNMAMLQPEGSYRGVEWSVRTLSDDIAWGFVNEQTGKLHMFNAENGMFGVVPGTGPDTNPVAFEMIKENTVYTNVALNPRTMEPYWEGQGPAPTEPILDWQGNPWMPWQEGLFPWGKKEHPPAAHPNSRFTTACADCPTISDQWENPAGVPISAILYGGRRETIAPLIFEARDWKHGVYVGATMGSEMTAAAAGVLGELREDPYAMRPFFGITPQQYMELLLQIGEKLGPNAPRIFQVNWFQKNEDGKFRWPGYGWNIAVLSWIFDRVKAQQNGHLQSDATRQTAIGYLPTLSGLGLTEEDIAKLGVRPQDWDSLLGYDVEAMATDVGGRGSYLDKFGETLPPAIRQEYDALIGRLWREGMEQGAVAELADPAVLTSPENIAKWVSRLGQPEL